MYDYTWVERFNVQARPGLRPVGAYAPVGERDDHYQGDQPSAIKSMCLGSKFLKSGLGQGFRVDEPQQAQSKRITPP